MRRRAAAVGAALVANAVGLLLAALLLEDMAVGWASFLLAVVVLSAVELVAHPAILRAGTRYLPAVVGVSALLATALGLAAAVVLADDLHVRGLGTWVLATVVVWTAAVVAGLLLRRVGPALAGRRVRAGGRARSRSRPRSTGRPRRPAATGRGRTWHWSRGPPAR